MSGMSEGCSRLALESLTFVARPMARRRGDAPGLPRRVSRSLLFDLFGTPHWRAKRRQPISRERDTPRDADADSDFDSGADSEQVVLILFHAADAT